MSNKPPKTAKILITRSSPTSEDSGSREGWHDQESADVFHPELRAALSGLYYLMDQGIISDVELNYTLASPQSKAEHLAWVKRIGANTKAPLIDVVKEELGVDYNQIKRSNMSPADQEEAKLRLLSMIEQGGDS